MTWLFDRVIVLQNTLFSCLYHASFLILLLLLMSGNVYSNPGPVFLCSACAGNVTRLGRSVQCCTCSKWVHLKCSLLSFSRFSTLGSSHSWNCILCCAPVSSGDPHLPHCVLFFGLLRLVYLHCLIWSIWPRSANVPALPSPSNFLPCFRSLRISSFCTLPTPRVYGCFSILLLLLPPLTPSRFITNGMTEVFESGALNYCTSCHLIL